MRAYDVAVLGGGVIGLSLARALRLRGVEVVVVERGEPGQEASSAAAGMLAAVGGDLPPAMAGFAQLSAKMYPAWLDELTAGADAPGEGNIGDSAQRIDLRQQGTILVGREGEDVGTAKRLTSNDRAHLEPCLQSEQAAFLIEESSLDPRGLMDVLLLATRRSGVHVMHGDAALAIAPAGQEWTVRTRHTELVCGAVVNCCGAWAGEITGAPQLPVRPRKGQMLALRFEKVQPIAHVIRGEDVYVVPRSDGRAVVGATVEDVGFDKRVEIEVIRRLRLAAEKLLPCLREARIEESWAGLRPGTSDDLPILGELEARLFVASGHFRNGILLAPATASCMTQVILGETSEIDLTPYVPQRFPGGDAKRA